MVLFFYRLQMLLTTTAKIKLYSQFYSKVFAFVRVELTGDCLHASQSAILQNRDFILRVERVLKVAFGHYTTESSTTSK